MTARISFDTFLAQTEAYLAPHSTAYGRDFNQFSNRMLVESYFALIKAYDSKVFLELGAHRATASRNFMRAEPGRFAIAIEANPFNYKRFCDAVQAGGTIYRNLALTDETGPVKMILSDTQRDRNKGHTSTANSILKRASFSDVMEVEVQGITFDDLITQATSDGDIPALINEPPVLWVDVEGATSQLLKGAQIALPKCLAVFVEVEAEALYEGQVTVEGIDAQFRALGFSPILRDCEYQPRQYNIIYVNDCLARADILDPIIMDYEKRVLAFVPPTDE